MKTPCPYCRPGTQTKVGTRTPRRWGRFRRKSDGQWVSRFWCPQCERHYSSATANLQYWQRKRHKNAQIFKLLVGGVSQRECARILRLNRKTVVRKFVFLATRSRQQFQQHNAGELPAVEVQFDDLESFEHSKCKPLSVTLMVEKGTRRILDFEVSRMPAKGLLAAIALKKYGFRQDERSDRRKRLFQRACKLISPRASMWSDRNPLYPPDVKLFFPDCHYETVLGGRGAVTGQGELKKLAFDPLFSLNHTCAMLRANINRLFRRTWCTTKRPDRLAMHIAMYAWSHNMRLRGATI